MIKFLRYGFYIVGTFLLIFSSIIVGANFIKDSGIIDKSIIEVKKQPQKSESAATPTRKPATATKTEAKDTKKAEETVASPTQNNEKLVIEVINCTEKSGLAEDTRAMLEAKGHQVSAATDKGSLQGTSQIIIRKKGVKADDISKLLRIPTVKEELQESSRFDITIILGSDFNP